MFADKVSVFRCMDDKYGSLVLYRDPTTNNPARQLQPMLSDHPSSLLWDPSKTKDGCCVTLSTRKEGHSVPVMFWFLLKKDNDGGEYIY